jgi:hypothetical protein
MSDVPYCHELGFILLMPSREIFLYMKLPHSRPSGQRSIIQSALLFTPRLGSTTVLPELTSSCGIASSFLMSSKCGTEACYVACPLSEASKAFSPQ